MLKIRRSYLIYNMGIPIPVKTGYIDRHPYDRYEGIMQTKDDAEIDYRCLQNFVDYAVTPLTTRSRRISEPRERNLDLSGCS